MPSGARGWTARWRADQVPIAVDTEERLRELLAAATADAEQQPLVIELHSPEGAELTIGLGQDVSVATFKASLDPPYYVSIGGLGQQPLAFYRDGHLSEFDHGAAISPQAAYDATLQFLASGVRPTNIEWREV